MRFLRRSLMGLFLLSITTGLLVFGAAGFYDALQERWSQEARVRPARERVLNVNVVTATAQDLRPVLVTFGEVRSRRTLDVRTVSGGTVIDLAPGFVEGGSVEAGELLLRIDPRNAQSALDVARTDLAEAEAEVRDAERALALLRDELAASQAQADLRAQAVRRQNDLSRRGVGTAAAVEAAELAASSADQAVVARRQAVAQGETRADLARTKLDRQRINLAEAERRLAETEVQAEFSGRLSEVSVVEGGLVSANERLARLIDPAELEVSFRLSTGQYARLLDSGGAVISAPVEAILDLSGEDLVAEGEISRAGAAVAEGQTGRLLFARLNDSAGFQPGDFVTVRVTEPLLRDVARLPASALDASGTVLAVGDGDRLEVVQTQVLRRQGDDVLLRGNGLFGRDVVAERSPLLGAGIKVTPLRPALPGVAEVAEETEALIELSPEQRQRLIAIVEANERMPARVKERLLAQLSRDRVPAATVSRIESRMGG